MVSKQDTKQAKHSNPPHSHEITAVRGVGAAAIATVGWPMIAPLLHGDVSNPTSLIIGGVLLLFAAYSVVKGFLSEVYAHFVPHL